jgi:hypothetical protein
MLPRGRDRPLRARLSDHVEDRAKCSTRGRHAAGTGAARPEGEEANKLRSSMLGGTEVNTGRHMTATTAVATKAATTRKPRPTKSTGATMIKRCRTDRDGSSRRRMEPGRVQEGTFSYHAKPRTGPGEARTSGRGRIKTRPRREFATPSLFERPFGAGTDASLRPTSRRPQQPLGWLALARQARSTRRSYHGLASRSLSPRLTPSPCAAIFRAAGPELVLACRALGGCRTGEVKITPGFDLAAKVIIPGLLLPPGTTVSDTTLWEHATAEQPLRRPSITCGRPGCVSPPIRL